ncbi:sec-independent protein translocase protein TatB [Thiohalospira halophila DSM 15071]|uniref:Sec-independent protein translocase protein TatB n=1 Tax=Thiohalospira halophila DSM 15071 TaxID=1123397 RepID=A0A1I1TJ90_9GAMM|nr:Sec-independent protein translocase protein TatB [Thiohalospira halophila]SFD57228.1 sec-independent protein translocase protein TatB [Thiohalospira halophila DSM 15071]
MFDLGFWELLLIGTIALLVIGPERLPEVARTVGGWVGKLRRYVSSVRSDIDRELRTEELRKMMESQQSELNNLRQRLEKTPEELDQDAGGDGSQYAVRARDDGGSAAAGEESSSGEAAGTEEAPRADRTEPADRPATGERKGE